jgi:hypothetical protein
MVLSPVSYDRFNIAIQIVAFQETAPPNVRNEVWVLTKTAWTALQYSFVLFKAHFSISVRVAVISNILLRCFC